MIAMRATERLIDDLVDQPELLQARSGDAKRFGGFGRMLCGFP